MKKLFSAVLIFLFMVCACACVRESGVHGEIRSEAVGQSASVKLPILMYHSILNSRKGRYIVSEAQFENDMKMLAENGFTTVTADEITAFAEGAGELPKKPVLITFDDGHYNNMSYGVPILEKYNMKALFNIVGSFSEYSSTSGDHSNPNYSHMTWEQIGELAAGGTVCFGNHSYNMHKFKPRYGIARKTGESMEQYVNALTDDTMRLQEKLFDACGYMPRVYAYPFGKYDDAGREVLEKLGFKMFLTCNEGVSAVTFGDTKSIKQLRRINREGGYSTAEVMKRISL